eukprot:Hpha_TRINITY_DN2823_c0_g1::TRINITY_DN2823_c0_g1_i1::g.171343::m.171343
MAARLGTAAAGAGVAGVAVLNGVCWKIRQEPAPPFTRNGDRWDQSTLIGRVKGMFMRCDPSTLLYSSADIRAAQEQLKTPKGDRSDDEMWRIRQVVESSVHPVTDAVVPQPARMAGYVPYNGPICVAMVVSSGTGPLLFWNWANQTVNAALNYCNNSGADSDSGSAVRSYVIAVSSALAVVYGLSTGVRRFAPEAMRSKLLRFTAFPACVVASSLNCYIVRRPEITVGLPLQDADGRPFLEGKTSSVAAEKAVMETVKSRMALQVPVYFFPAVVLATPPGAALMAAGGPMATFVSTFVTFIGFGLGLPWTLAYYPQQTKISRSELEPELQAALPPGVDAVYCHRGL